MNVEEDGDLMEHGVNIAARLEGVAKPGAICLSLFDLLKGLRRAVKSSLQNFAAACYLAAYERTHQRVDRAGKLAFPG